MIQAGANQVKQAIRQMKTANAAAARAGRTFADAIDRFYFTATPKPSGPPVGSRQTVYWPD